MPTYVYKCDKCEHEFELKQSFSDKPRVKCPQCKKRALYKVPQLSHFFVKNATSEIKTLGHLADRNTSKMGKYELEKKREELPAITKKKKDKSLAKLAKLTKEQQRNYIETGKIE